jgi:hypothetical protein
MEFIFADDMSQVIAAALEPGSPSSGSCRTSPATRTSSGCSRPRPSSPSSSQHGNICQIYSSVATRTPSTSPSSTSTAATSAPSSTYIREARGSRCRNACHIISRACEGLDYAHNKKDNAGSPLNIIHRDISPPNVLDLVRG